MTGDSSDDGNIETGGAELAEAKEDLEVIDLTTDMDTVTDIYVGPGASNIDIIDYTSIGDIDLGRHDPAVLSQNDTVPCGQHTPPPHSQEYVLMTIAELNAWGDTQNITTTAFESAEVSPETLTRIFDDETVELQHQLDRCEEEDIEIVQTETRAQLNQLRARFRQLPLTCIDQHDPDTSISN